MHTPFAFYCFSEILNVLGCYFEATLHMLSVLSCVSTRALQP